MRPAHLPGPTTTLWKTTKLTPFAGTDWDGPEAFSATLLKPGQFDRYLSFMTSPVSDCTCGWFEKPKVWPNGDSSADRGRG